MDFVLILVWLAFGTIAALLIYDFLVMPGVRKRARAEAEPERERLEAEVHRLTAECARLKSELQALDQARAPAPEPDAAEVSAPEVASVPAEEFGEVADPSVLAEAAEIVDLTAFDADPAPAVDPSALAETAESGDRFSPGEVSEPADVSPKGPDAEPVSNSILLVLVRHGEAVEAADDAARELTQVGRREVRILSAEFSTRGFTPAVVRTSPLRWANQTAQIMVTALSDPVSVEDAEALAPACGVDGLLRLLESEPPGTSVCWVGHQPDLGAFAARLLGHAEGLELPTGSALALRVDPAVDPPTATLEWAWLP